MKGSRLWPAAQRYIPNGRISSRRSALRHGNKCGAAMAQYLKCAIGRDAARIGANDAVFAGRIPERWRKLFARAFVVAAVRTSRRPRMPR